MTSPILELFGLSCKWVSPISVIQGALADRIELDCWSSSFQPSQCSGYFKSGVLGLQTLSHLRYSLQASCLSVVELACLLLSQQSASPSTSLNSSNCGQVRARQLLSILSRNIYLLKSCLFHHSRLCPARHCQKKSATHYAVDNTPPSSAAGRDCTKPGTGIQGPEGNHRKPDHPSPDDGRWYRNEPEMLEMLESRIGV